LPFFGTFDFTLDAKNRLTIPSRHRAAFAEGVVLARGLEPCISIWRSADYDRWMQSTLAGHSPLSAEYRQMNRFLAANSHPTELDGAGRVQLPPFLIDSVKLQREVSLVGAGECLEVWDRASWATYNDEVVANVSDIAAGLYKPAS
jgi:MraZ protein